MAGAIRYLSSCSRKSGSGFVALVLAFLFVASASPAQDSLAEGALNEIPTVVEPETGFRSGSLVVAPIPFSNPTVGNGLALGGAWLFNSLPGSQTSSIGAGGFKTDNGSFGYAARSEFVLSNNRYKVSLLAGHVDLNYDFTLDPFDFELNQTGDLVKVDFAYGLTSDFFIGVGARYAETKISTAFGGLLPPEVTAGFDLSVLKYGFVADWDRRDNDLYPSNGARVRLDLFHGEVTGRLGSDYRKGVLQLQAFKPGFDENDVAAFSATYCTASKSAPFFDSCALGLVDGMRGFSVTEHIGTELISAQAEYRGRFGRSRFGYVAFAGIGKAGGFAGTDDGLHAAVGLGLRFRISRAFPVDLSFDITTNSDGESPYYVYVGQSF